MYKFIVDFSIGDNFMKKCVYCKQQKPDSEFGKHRFSKDGLQARCKDCQIKFIQSRREINRDRTRMAENKECSQYLGCYINERILKHVMPNAVLMDYNNPGFDLVCGKGYLVDAKAATMRYAQKKYPIWVFKIKHNKTPDYFLLTAYKDRVSLEIMYMWLIPGDVINDKDILGISLSKIHKWDDYRVDHTEALNCVTKIKASA